MSHDATGCREIFARLSEYIDGELPQDLCDEVERHFGGCAPCEAFLESLRRTVRWIEQAGDEPLPEDLRRAVRRSRR